MEHEYTELGQLVLEQHQHNLISKFAQTILDGTFQQAVETFEIIFGREPADDLEMQIFQALCEQKLKEKDGDYGIKGVIQGGASTKSE
jgi:hypothetical protein